MATNGQVGLPLTVIVGAVIAALVLVTIISFTVGGTGTTFGKISKTAASTGDEVSAFRATCTSLCNAAKPMETRDAWTSSDYITSRFNIDKDASGDLTGDEIGIRCWEAPLNINCRTNKVFTVGTVQRQLTQVDST